ncbi:hypothetical protein OPV22_023033 [Ensete ventricosum]|uniref:Uncharacterized protein n=1 Tax=Ensete ventricosum TaxID=4639 RepID=A0AAV8QL07_ENSVE|nr:hypothetical protein OPV22_023033 [Ensete ventricosum]
MCGNCEYFGVLYLLFLMIIYPPPKLSHQDDPDRRIQKSSQFVLSRQGTTREHSPSYLFPSHDDDDDGGDGFDLEKETEAEERAELLKYCFLLFVISAGVPFLLLPPICLFPIADSAMGNSQEGRYGGSKTHSCMHSPPRFSDYYIRVIG